LIVMAIYSREYLGAVELLRWVCAGMALRILSWPLGFIVVAKGRQAIYFLSELAWALVSLLLAWGCIEAFGLRGAGIAFFLSYVFHTAMLLPISHALTGFRWSSDNRRLACGGALGLAGVALLLAVLPPLAATLGGLAIALAAGLHAVARMAQLIPPTNAPRAVRVLCALSDRALRLFNRGWPRRDAGDAAS
jgi:PST family polysaccharide transporter